MNVFYLALNKSDAKDTDIEKICDTMVNSLFSFLVTIGMRYYVSFIDENLEKPFHSYDTVLNYLISEIFFHVD